MALTDRNNKGVSRLSSMVCLKLMWKLKTEASAKEIVLCIQQHGIRTRESIRTMEERGH